jgi:hypothetical protein
MAVAALTPPLKWHGGKHHLARRIVARMPPRLGCKTRPGTGRRSVPERVLVAPDGHCTPSLQGGFGMSAQSTPARPDRQPSHSAVKRAVRRLHGNRCAECGADTGLSVHRRTPGSPYTVAGCVLLCAKCHGEKHVTLPWKPRRARHFALPPGVIPPNSLPIVGPAGYRVDRQGGVWTCWRLRRHAPRIMSDRWERLNPSPTASGHVRLNIAGPGGVRRQVLVHTLVLEAFVGPCPRGLECRHLNDDPSDNRLENLCWGTRLENAEDRWRNGILPRGEDYYTAKLTTADIHTIRARCAAGEPQRVVAADFGLNQSQVSRIVNRRRWGHV